MALREIYSKQDLAINAVGKHIRKMFRQRVIDYNYPAIVKLAYNDAITYNPETGKGGTVMGLNFRKQKRNKFNLPYVGIIENMLYLKKFEADARFDPLSNSDYLQSWSIVAIKETGGPDLTEHHKIGRVDATSEEDLEGADAIPDPDKGASAFRDLFYKKGFSDKDLVALSYVYMFGVFKTAYQRSYTNHSVFSNAYYQFLANSNKSHNHSLDKILLGDAALKEYVELFAENKKEFHNAFTDAYLKLHTLGNDDKPFYLEIDQSLAY